MNKTAKHPLATWREAQNPSLTQKAFAELVVCDRWTINSIETGRRRASRELASTIIKATNSAVSFEDLMAWEPSVAAASVPDEAENAA